MADDIFEIRMQVSQIERSTEEAAATAVKAGSAATQALHDLRAALTQVNEALGHAKAAADRGDEARAQLIRLREGNKIHPDTEQAYLGMERAMTDVEESLSNLLHLKNKIEDAIRVATDSGYPAGVNAPVNYQGVRQWLSRWVARL